MLLFYGIDFSFNDLENLKNIEKINILTNRIILKSNKKLNEINNCESLEELKITYEKNNILKSINKNELKQKRVNKV